MVFSPEVPIRLDYHGKRVDLTHGPLAGLLMGLGQLNCSELRLKPLSYRFVHIWFNSCLCVGRILYFSFNFQAWIVGSGSFGEMDIARVA